MKFQIGDRVRFSDKCDGTVSRPCPSYQDRTYVILDKDDGSPRPFEYRWLKRKFPPGTVVDFDIDGDPCILWDDEADDPQNADYYRSFYINIDVEGYYEDFKDKIKDRMGL